MSKPRRSLDFTVRITFLVLMALLTLFLGFFFLLVFVPVVGWYVWSLNDKIRDLEARLAPPEEKGQKS